MSHDLANVGQNVSWTESTSPLPPNIQLHSFLQLYPLVEVVSRIYWAKSWMLLQWLCGMLYFPFTSPLLLLYFPFTSPGIDTRMKGPTAYTVSSERHRQNRMNKVGWTELPKLQSGGGWIKPPSSWSTGSAPTIRPLLPTCWHCTGGGWYNVVLTLPTFWLLQFYHMEFLP